MVLDTDPRPFDIDHSPDYNYPNQNLNVELISLANDNGVGDMRPDCLTGLRNVQWTAFTAYGVGGPVEGITVCLTLH